MPPNARKAPRRGGEGGESSNVVRSEDDGSNEERDAARERKAALRNQHLNVLRELRERGKKMLLEGGMQQLRTEGVGDCWLIGLLAGSEGFDAQQVQRFTDNQRNKLLTPWRKRLVEVAPHVDTKCFTMSGEPLGIEVFKQVASSFVSAHAIRKQEEANQWGEECRVRNKMKSLLQPWAQPYHFGKNQQAVHVCMGLILKKNILEIEFRGRIVMGECMCMLRAPWSFPVPPSPLQCSVVPVLASQLSLRCA